MAESKEFTYSDVSEHTSKKDLYMVIHDKVYNTSSFVDEHPGGEEVLLDVGGQDATEAFEDVGHSDEAREILDGLLIGTLKRQAGDPQPKTAAQQVADARKSSTASGGLGAGVYAVVLVGAALAFFAYQQLQSSQNKS
ncbi:cytochrome b5 [Sphaerulina musiva SO2202]|uniref:Cytochrome b5 n=1 Tax=Sphaerulina musiva (strain SO2202) TaxID=692275 RepID=N1QJD2_SPHMS|nr:cytochrome b5 [Sphaerulina musiva SO2202]EMF17346.1 cytochrome b5 [Sphaerulina musiva SO2202]